MTIKYDVPLYTQGNLPLCWAFSQTMIESYQNGETLPQRQATARAKSYRWKYKQYKADGRQMLIMEIVLMFLVLICFMIFLFKMAQFMLIILQKIAHFVVVTGVNLYKGVVYTNNPWGVRGTPSFDEFQNGFATK